MKMALWFLRKSIIKSVGIAAKMDVNIVLMGFGGSDYHLLKPERGRQINEKGLFVSLFSFISLQ
jgi:hypothetical protein